MKALAEFIAKGLGADPASVRAEEQAADNSVSVTLRLPMKDVQAFDGREHRTARAVRQVLSAAAAAQDKRFTLTVEPEA